MASRIDLVWHGRVVEASIDVLTVRILDALAIECAGLTRRNISENGQIDTGFMLNTVQAFGPLHPGIGGGMQVVADRDGRQVVRHAAAVEGTGPRSAATAVAANYSIYHELEKAFLYPAAEETARNFGAIVRTVRGDS